MKAGVGWKVQDVAGGGSAHTEDPSELTPGERDGLEGGGGETVKKFKK